MKKLLYLFLLLFFYGNVFSQPIKSKDGIIIGDRKDFISTCSLAGQKQSPNFNIGVTEIGWEEYCSCVVDKIIPNISSYEMALAISKNDIMGLFLKQENLDIIMNCVEGFFLNNEKDLINFELSPDNDPRLAKIQKDLAVKECIKEVKSIEQDLFYLEDSLTEKQVEEYCNCTVEKMFEGGYTYGDMLDIENENSATYNEIVVPCLSKILKTDTDLNKKTISNLSITGGGASSRIPLTNYFGEGYKLKINIGGIERYFLLDTGASDIIIDRDVERELLLNGLLSREDYLGKSEYIMANNQVIDAQVVRVDKITIGDYTIKNVELSIIDSGALLCGISFLDMFKKWEIDKNSNTLILYK